MDTQWKMPQGFTPTAFARMIDSLEKGGIIGERFEMHESIPPDTDSAVYMIPFCPGHTEQRQASFPQTLTPSPRKLEQMAANDFKVERSNIPKPANTTMMLKRHALQLPEGAAVAYVAECPDCGVWVIVARMV